MKLLVVLNPKAAGGRAGRLSRTLQEAFKNRGVEATFVPPAGRGAAETWLAARDIAAFDGVVAAGGDGTCFEVLNGLMAHEAKNRPTLGLIPLGTGNAFCRDIGLEPGNWQQAIDVICAGDRRPVDVGHATWSGGDCYFLNILGIGFVVEAGRAAEKLKWLGSAAYSLGTIRAALRSTCHELLLNLDGEQIHLESLLLEVANSRYTGTSFRIAPHARIDDGLLDVVLVRSVGRVRLFRLLPTIYSGRHVDHAEVIVRQRKCIEVLSPVGVPLLIDGEVRGKTPTTIRCLAGALELYSG